MDDTSLGIVLANTGTPDEPTPEAVERYLKRFLMDPRIRPLPAPLWWCILHFSILPKRKFSSATRYQEVWTDEGSPLVVHQDRLAKRLQQALDRLARQGLAPRETMVRSAMAYSSPDIAQVLAEMRKAGMERVVLLPLYPQRSYSSSLAVVDEFKEALSHMGWSPKAAVVEHYFDQPAYVKAVANSIRRAGFDPASSDRLVMSFHSVPLKDLEAGDDYDEETRRTRELVAEELGMRPDAITYGTQCVFGGHPERWMGPLTRDIVATWDKQDFGRVFVVLPGFAVDCLETIYDVNHDIVPIFRRAGGGFSHEVVRVPCLNEGDDHVAALLAVLKPYLRA